MMFHYGGWESRLWVDAELTLREPVHRVERRAVWYWTLRATCLLVPVVAALVVIRALVEPTRTAAGVALMATLAVGAIYVFVVPSWRYVVHRWETTDEAVYARSGWYVREWRVAPISRIQTVDTSRGPIEQVLGLATLAVTTASSHGAVYIRGLDHVTARRTADSLAETTQLTPGDQT